MQTYYATESAGAKIAGKANPGVNQPIRLSEQQAAYYLRTGELSATAPAATKEPEARGKAHGRD